MTDDRQTLWHQAQARLQADPDLAPFCGDVLAHVTSPGQLQWLTTAPPVQVLAWLLQQQHRSYAGWPNYPTWALWTWCSQDAEHLTRAQDVVTGARWPAAALSEWAHDVVPESGLGADLLAWLLGLVAWDRVAAAVADRPLLPEGVTP